MTSALRASALALAAWSSVSALAGAAQPPKPCAVLAKDDIFRILGWHVERMRRRSYHFGGLTGEMCNIESPEGIVTTIVPDRGSDFPGITADNTPDSGDLVQSLPGLGADVQLFNGTVYVTSGHRRVAVKVVPETHPATYADVAPFAKIIVKRLKR